MAKRSNWTVAEMFAETLIESDIKGKRTLIRFQDNTMTYEEIDRASNQLAHCLHTLGYGYGSVVPLMMNNCHEYMIVWLALTKIGAITALVNTESSNMSLLHCLKTALVKSSGARPLSIIMGHEYRERFTPEIQSKLVKDFRDVAYYVFSKGDQERGNLNSLAAIHPATALSPRLRSQVKINDDVFIVYINTSGTNGLPQAVRISHLDVIISGYIFKTLNGFKDYSQNWFKMIMDDDKKELLNDIYQ